MEKLVKDLEERKRAIRERDGEKRVTSQHKKGKLTAWERIDLLLDKDSFSEINPFVMSRVTDFGLDKKRTPGDAVITGYGRINGRKVYIFSQDFTTLGGSLGEMHAQKIARIQDLAMANGCPLIQMNDSGGARIQEGVLSLNGYGMIFRRNSLSSGVIPQLSLILGPSAGGAVYASGLSDFVFMVRGVSRMYITGPDVIKRVAGEEIGHEELGGADVHAQVSGVAHFAHDSEEECFKTVRRLLSYLPQNAYEIPPYVEPAQDLSLNEDINQVIPLDPEESYDVHDVIEAVFDEGSFLEIHEEYAMNVVVGLARLYGHVVGIVANQPEFMAGVLDINASDKIARFVRFCDCFNIPLINLIDTPGYLPGSTQEFDGIIRHGAKILFAYSEATVPKIVLIMRKAYGGAYIALCSRDMAYDRVLAYPTADIAVMGAEGAVAIIFRKELAAADNPEKRLEELKSQYMEKFGGPYLSASYGLVDQVIAPAETRRELFKALDSVMDKQESRPEKKHGNIPL
ncbi:MAG: methylmalonyl-CoA carboxyltransferase [Deltaproteobacteria bacterium]|nr:MAG: methylmalonyl-CoA carboxyltransferase [Deltaproteobacteria bacterium]